MLFYILYIDGPRVPTTLKPSRTRWEGAGPRRFDLIVSHIYSNTKQNIKSNL